MEVDKALGELGLTVGWDTCPKLHMRSTCVNLWRELSSSPHNSTGGGNLETVDTKAADHIADARAQLLVLAKHGADVHDAGNLADHPRKPAAGGWVVG